MKLVSTIALAAAIALAPGIAGAKQNNKHVTRSAAAQPAHIACTKYGCAPVAPNCRPHTQLDWRGNPTGYDQIVCR
jgi:hypothetical protein